MLDTIALEQLRLTLSTGEATEAFGFVIRTLDTFRRIIRNIKITLMNPATIVKRSELKAYHDSHQSVLKQFFSTKLINYEQMVPIPSGMKVTYLKATSVLDELYQKLAIEATTKTLMGFLNTLSLSTLRKDIETTTNTITRLTHDQLETALRGVFSSEKTGDKPLGSVIATFADLVILDQHILTYDEKFRSVEVICSDLNKIESLIDTLITTLEHSVSPDMRYVRALYQLVHTASVQYDAFGVILAESQRVEHNFVILLRQLVAANV